MLKIELDIACVICLQFYLIHVLWTFMIAFDMTAYLGFNI